MHHSTRNQRKRYVIVGCGASGSALAAKLCQSSSAEVVVLEQGTVTWPMQREVHRASLWAKAALDGRTQHALTTPQEHLMQRQVKLPMGSGIGGSMNVNAMMWGLGHRRVFDEQWPEGFDSETMER